MSELRSLGRRQASALEEFRRSEEATLLTRLAQTECLLELAKLSSERFDLSAYAGAAVGVITQFLPTVACSLSIEVTDVPEIRSTYGLLADVLPPGTRHPLVADDRELGELVVVPEVAEAGPSEFLEKIAAQISSGIGILVEAERLRRRAAVSQAFRLVDALSDEPGEETLRELVGAIALLPHALGARLDVDHSSLPGPVTLFAGMPPAEHGDAVEVPGGAFGLAMRWSSSASGRETESLAEIVEMLTASFARAEERRRLRDEAETDPLTGVGNRRRALRTLAESLNHAELHDSTVGVIYLDLDHFKAVNDELGHEVGDEVLVRFATHLREEVRERDSVSRFGGEEFLLVCPGLDERSGAAMLARILERTPKACANPLPDDWRLTVSAGLACFPSAANHSDALIRAADSALYEAKSAGRNTYRVAGRTSRRSVD